MEFEELKRLLKKYEINISDTVEHEYDKYVDRKKYKIEDELVDIVKSYFPDVRIQFIHQIFENCIEQPLKSVSYGRKDVTKLDEQLIYAVDDVIKSIEKSKNIYVIDSELESNLKQIVSKFSLSRLDSCAIEFKEAIRRYFMYRYESPYMSSRQIEISLENLLYDLEKKVASIISSIETDMKDIIIEQYSSFRKMVVERIEEFRKENSDLKTSENEESFASKTDEHIEVSNNVGAAAGYEDILEIADYKVINRDEKLSIKNNSNGLVHELIRLNDYFISTDFDIELASSKNGLKSYANNSQGISIVMDNYVITINDEKAGEEIVIEDGFDGKDIKINGELLINREDKEAFLKQISSKYPGLYQYLSRDLQLKKEYADIFQKIDEEKTNKKSNRALFLDDDIFNVKASNNELLEELREQDRIDDQADQMINELDKMVEFSESVKTNLDNDEDNSYALPSNLIL